MPLPRRQIPPIKSAKSGVSNGDARFANFETDLKFRLPSKKHRKIKLDSRFSRLQGDPDFHSKASVDKYGRKISNKAGKEALKRTYNIIDGDDQSVDRHDLSGSNSESERDEKVLKELERVEKLGLDPIRDGGLESSSNESSSDEEEEIEVEGLTEVVGDATAIPTGDISSRLAVVNMDWDNVRASDIMAVAASFVPADGRIFNVVVYMSDFGRERTQREEVEGPPREIFALTAAKREDTSIEINNPSQISGSEDDAPLETDLADHGSNEEYNSTALRNYQLDRLRYYYAIITCSSASVAKSIYDNLDGQEYLASANFFDLRFVPDGTTFDEDAHDECSKLPDDYKPHEFTTDALTHSKVKLTWDADDTERKEVQKRAFSRREINENELQAYLGTDSSSSEEEIDAAKENKAMSLRKALGLETSSRSGMSAKKAKASGKKDRDFPKPDGEMEITFTGGLMSNIGNGTVFQDEIPMQETTMEKYIRKEKERKAKRKERNLAKREDRNNAAQVESVDKGETIGDGDDGFDDPFFASGPEDADKGPKLSQKARRAIRRAEKEEQEKVASSERANLDLLMADDDGSQMRHFDMKEIIQAEKAKKKGKKGKTGDSATDNGFQIDTLDPRFARLYESHEFAIDPTNPRFKGTTGMKALLEEGRKKRKHDKTKDEPDKGRDSTKLRKKDYDAEDSNATELAARIKAKSRQSLAIDGSDSAHSCPAVAEEAGSEMKQ